MLGRLRSVLGSSLGHNVFYLYLAQGANYLFPLLLLPYLSRTLKPEGFGAFVAGQAFSIALVFLLDHGFSLLGTREVARNRENSKTLGIVLAGVLGARFLLLIPAIALTLGAHLLIPIFQSHPAVAVSALLQAWFSALSPSWFYRGLERMREVAFLELFTRALAFGGVLLMVRGPGDAHLPLLLNASAAGIAGFLGLGPLFIRFRPTFSLEVAWHFLVLGSRLIPFNATQALSVSINPLALSFFVSPAGVGFFSGAERLVRSFWGFLEPLGRALFPRLASLTVQDEVAARRFFLKVLLVMGVAGFGSALALELLAPLIVGLLLGPSYAESIVLMRIMAPILLLGSLSHALGVQWGLAWGMENLLNRVSLFSALLQLVLAFLLGATYGAVGVAWGLVFVSWAELLALSFGLLRYGKLPLGGDRNGS